MTQSVAPPPARTAERPTHLLYLHGFRSSPRSAKAEATRAWLARHRPALHWWCPQLPPSPRDAMSMVEQGIADWPRDRMAVVGSSLGGFYATFVGVRQACPAVLLNPAVDPARDLARHIGEQVSWHDPQDRFFFRPEYVDELRALTLPRASLPKPCLAIIAKGDEVLDWREMAARCAGADIRLLEGGDHALSDYVERHLPEVLRFLQLLD